MIRYALRCASGHGFEAWFRSSADHDLQERARQITCPVCGTDNVAKAMMAPSLASGAASEGASVETAEAEFPGRSTGGTAELAELGRRIRESAEYVGRRFPDEARRRYDQEDPGRNPVWGEATADEAADLLSDGIPILPLPPSPKDQN